jgi:hypothetical protein
MARRRVSRSEASDCRSCRTHRNLKGRFSWNQQIEIFDEGIKHQTAVGTAVYRWAAFSKFTSSDRVVLVHFDPPVDILYQPPQAFLIIPSAFFADEAEWNRFLGIVQQKLPKKYQESHSRQ